MGGLIVKGFAEPDKVVNLVNCSGQVVTLGEVFVGRYVHAPGWSWARDVKPVAGTPSCQVHHIGTIVAGRMEILMDDGARRVIAPGEVYDIPPGHDAWIVGDEPCVRIEWTGARDWGKPTTGGDRVLANLLVTDIVGSTALATKLGDAKWKDLLARHNDRVRREFDRYHGLEVVTTGDGFLAMFDGTARAVNCAVAICRVATEDGLAVRAGLHSGEVERHADNIRGMAVHVVSRIAALAAAGEVLVSSTVAALLEGAGVSLEDAGEHELKGVDGRRRVYRIPARPVPH